MKCVCVCFKEKKREETQTHPVAWGPLSWELRMKNTERKFIQFSPLFISLLVYFSRSKRMEGKEKI
jgi:hypothetical protein